MVRELFFAAIEKYTRDKAFRDDLWNKISRRYNGFGRHYHTLSHLEHLATELTPFKNNFSCWETLVFALVYHDFIYNIFSTENEERSARYTVRVLRQISYPENETLKCRQFIMATRKHEPDDDREINLFTDADLSILGADAGSYLDYTAHIRKEYFAYPDFIYIPGRRKVVNHFLNMKRIFKTDPFYTRYELRARENLKTELQHLNG